MLFQLTCSPKWNAALPSELPPSPGLGIIQSDGYMDEATIEFATQFRATPPAIHKFLIFVSL